MLNTLITFCGVGGTGKTTTAGQLVRLRPDMVTSPSIVRDYYRRESISDETAFLELSPVDRFTFQHGLLLHYLSAVEMQVTLARRDGKALVLDRSAYDHIAYLTYGYPDMTLPQLQEVHGYIDRFRALRPIVFYFPYPTFWTAGAGAEDGFRATGVGKNWALNAMMCQLLRDYHDLHEVVPVASPIQRAEFIIKVVADMQGVAHA